MSGGEDLSAADAGAADAGADATAASIRVDILRGAPTAEELAAVVAVVTESYRQEAATAVADPAPTASAWRVSARALREPLRRAIGWGRFGG